MRNVTAWFGSEHPAQHEHCQTCGAEPGQRCRSTVGPGFVAEITGMHRERLDASKAGKDAA